MGDAGRRQAESFPELFDVEVSDDGRAVGVTNRHGTRFIICANCQNITLRIDYASFEVKTMDEARRLVSAEGYNCISRVESFGTQDRSFATLSPLAVAEKRVVEELAAARTATAGLDDEDERGEAIARAVDSALAAWMARAHQQDTRKAAGERLKHLFASAWEDVPAECADLLLDAEVLWEYFEGRAVAEPGLDFSPVVLAYSKPLEWDLRRRLFDPYGSASEFHELPAVEEGSRFDRNVRTLKDFIAGDRPLAIGEMAFCLLTVGCKLRARADNGFARFLDETVGGLQAFCDDTRFAARLIEYVQQYRNKCAHTGRLSVDECLAARSLLLEEPVHLLVSLEAAVQRRAFGSIVGK